MNPRSRIAAASLIFTLLAAAGTASAQPGSASKSDEPLLKGPSVKERDVPGVVNSFGQGQTNRRMAAERIPPEVLRDAFGVLTRDDAPADIRATPEQEEAFKTVTDELRAAVRKYMADNREELTTLRKDANLSGRAAQEVDRAIGRRPGQGDAKGQGKGDARRERARNAESDAPSDAPAMMDEADEQRQDAARQRLREIMAGAPKIEDYITRVWEGLSAPQREAVDAKLNDFRETEAKKREEAYVRQRVDGREKGAEQAAAAAPLSAEKRDRLMRLFARLSPQQQDALLERLESAGLDGGPKPAAANRLRGNASKTAGNKPAPAMDDVEVPRPNDVE